MDKEYYTLSDLALMSGLNDRTLRNYLSTGVLQGEKVDGKWQFTEEQGKAFMSHPMVKQSIQTKSNAIIYDFLSDDRKSEPECCMVIDIPTNHRADVSGFFCRKITFEPYTNIRFSYNRCGKVSRVIIKGYLQDVIKIVSEFQSTFS